MQRAERCCKTRFAVDIMSYQYNYNHFEPCYSNYGYPWMPVAAPGLGSTLHTGADRGNEPSCSTKTSHYTVALKIFSPLNKREYQQHSLRNIDPKVISTPQELKEEISLQVGEAVPRFQEFPIGFYQETKKMWIQNKEDLRDAWELLDRNKTLCGTICKTAIKRSILLLIEVVNMMLYPTQTVKLVKLPEANEGRHQVD